MSAALVAPPTVRDGAPADAPALSAIARAAKAHWGYDDTWLALWGKELTLRPDDAERLTVRVVDVAGAPAAWCALAHGGTGAWVLEHLWVTPAQMGLGLGRALVRDAITLARRAGAESIVTDADPHAEAFYRALGFVRVGAVPAPMPGAPDRVLPQLRLDLAREIAR